MHCVSFKFTVNQQPSLAGSCYSVELLKPEDPSLACKLRRDSLGEECSRDSVAESAFNSFASLSSLLRWIRSLLHVTPALFPSPWLSEAGLEVSPIEHSGAFFSKESRRSSGQATPALKRLQSGAPLLIKSEVQRGSTRGLGFPGSRGFCTLFSEPKTRLAV